MGEGEENEEEEEEPPRGECCEEFPGAENMRYKKSSNFWSVC